MTTENIAFYLAVESKKYTKYELISMLQYSANLYMDCIKNGDSDEKIKEAYTSILYISSLITIKESDESPEKFAEKARLMDSFALMMDKKNN